MTCHGSSPTAGPARPADRLTWPGPPARPLTPGQQAPTRLSPPGVLVPASGRRAAAPAAVRRRGRRQVRHAGLPAEQQDLRVRRAVVLAQRAGQVPGVQVPLGARRPGHPAHRDQHVAVPVVRQVPDGRQPPRVGPGRAGEGRDVLRPGGIRQRGQFRRVLPGQLAGQGVGVRPGGHQPGQPAGRRIVEVLVVVISHAAQVPGQVGHPPLRAGRGASPARLGKLGGKLADHRHAVVERGERQARRPSPQGLPAPRIRAVHGPSLPALGHRRASPPG